MPQVTQSKFIQGKALDRLIAFTDAIVAVAITLLVLPLTDFFGGVTSANLAAKFASREFIQLVEGFLISFLTIFSFWNSHRLLFAEHDRLPRRAYWFNMVWLLVILLIPAMTSILVHDSEGLPTIIYGGALLLGSVCSVAMRWSIMQTYRLRDFVTTGLLLISELLAWLWPFLGPTVFYTLLLSPLIKRHLKNTDDMD